MSLTLEDAARVGGSDLSAILGRSPWATPLSVYARIVGALEGRLPPDNGNAATRRGHHLEAAVLALYAEETGATVHPKVSLQHAYLPYVRASLDGVAHRDGRRVVEVKTAGLSEVLKWGEAGTDQIPEAYIFQVQWYAGIAYMAGEVDTKAVDVAALVAGDLRIYNVPFDADLYAGLEEAAARFWTDHVLPRRPPPPSGPFQDLAAVGYLHRTHSGDVRHWDTLQPPEQVAISEYLRAKEQEQAAVELRASWELRAKLAMGSAPQLVGLPEHLPAHRIDWKQNKAGKVTDWEEVSKTLATAFNVRPEQYKIAVQEHTTTKEGARPFVARGRKHG